MRFLIHPRPVTSYSVGIFLRRVARELERRGHTWTALPFNYLGVSFRQWDVGFFMGIPRFINRGLASGKPTVLTMGKFQPRDEAQACGLHYGYDCEIQKQKMMRAIQQTERVVFISNYVCSLWRAAFAEFGQLFPESARVRVIHHGVDIDSFHPAPTLPTGPFVLGTFGALRRRFRLETLFNVSKLLPFIHKILIVGSMDDACRDVYRQAMLDSSLRKRTQYIPWVPETELPSYYQKIHVLFHPVDFEGCGIVCIEALACGVPVVVPINGAPREYLGGGGLVVDTPQYRYDQSFCERMAKAVCIIYDNNAEYSHRAREQAERSLSIVKTVDSYLGFLENPSAEHAGMGIAND